MDERLRRAAALEAEADQLRAEVEANPPKIVRTPYLIEDGPRAYRVGVRDEPQHGDYPYNGPCAEVTGDQTWIYVSTDAYEGTAMINREALPLLIEALQRLEKRLNE